MLTIENLSKTYRNGVQALKGVDLDIPEGVFGLLGPNGAGKSTLMNAIATLLQIDSGSIALDGLDVLQEQKQVRKILGYLPQDFGVYPRMSAEAMLDHFAVLKGFTKRRERRDVVRSLLQTTNLWNVRKQRLGTYSGGMRQRFGVAQALLGEPRLIIVDEPTAGLDLEERRRFLDLLCEIGQGVVVILSTHIVEDVSEVCSNVAIIDQGAVRLTGEPRSLLAGLEGRIWRKPIAQHELSACKNSLAVISSRLIAGRTVIHVYSASSPGEAFEPVAPSVEDVYFATLKGVYPESQSGKHSHE